METVSKPDLKIESILAPYWPTPDNPYARSYVDDSTKYYDYLYVNPDESNSSLDASNQFTFTVVPSESYKLMSSATVDVEFSLSRTTPLALGATGPDGSQYYDYFHAIPELLFQTARLRYNESLIEDKIQDYGHAALLKKYKTTRANQLNKKSGSGFVIAPYTGSTGPFGVVNGQTVNGGAIEISNPNYVVAATGVGGPVASPKANMQANALNIRQGPYTVNGSTGTSAKLSIPLSDIFGFYESNRLAVNNQTIKIELQKASNLIEALYSGTTNPGTVAIHYSKIQLRIPVLKPSDKTRLLLLEQYKLGDKFPIVYSHWSGYYSAAFNGDTTDIQWLISTNIRKPTYLMVGFRIANDNTNINQYKDYFTNLNINNSYILLNNGLQIPQIAYNTDFPNGKYSQLYNEFLQNIIDHDPDSNFGDNVITYDQYKNLCVICFDLSHKDDSNTIDNQASILLQMTRTNSSPTLLSSDSFKGYACVFTERTVYMANSASGSNIVTTIPSF